jgi:hypothetical protein
MIRTRSSSRRASPTSSRRSSAASPPPAPSRAPRPMCTRAHARRWPGSCTRSRCSPSS